MRTVLPTMYRGAAESIEVCLHVFEPRPSPDYELGPLEGFYLYDPHPGGNGAARALHRDGVELLLRLCRVYIERVLYHDRIRARYDHWADAQEIMARQDKAVDAAQDGTCFVDLENIWDTGAQAPATLEGTRDGEDAHDPAVADTVGGAIRQRDREVRRRALIWLDSRLRPEGSLAGGRALGRYGSGAEDGEGDVSDIGRCWYSRTGSITDLLWAKHRWQLDDDGGEAMADVAFDRGTAARSRFLEPASPALEGDMKLLSEQLQNPAFHLEDQRVWGTPRPLWMLDAGGQTPVGSEGDRVLAQPMIDHHLFVAAVAAFDYEAVGPLAALLLERSQADPTTPEGRYALICYVAKFIQGIPGTGMHEPRGGHTPVSTLLHRLGDADSKSLLMAMLMRHCGVDAGLFVSLEQERAMAAVAAFDTGSLDLADADASMERLTEWREQVGLVHDDMMWAEMPGRPGGPEANVEVFIPVDTMRLTRPGIANLPHPERWVFLPLSAVWFRLGLEEDAQEDADDGENAEESV